MEQGAHLIGEIEHDLRRVKVVVLGPPGQSFPALHLAALQIHDGFVHRMQQRLLHQAAEFLQQVHAFYVQAALGHLAGITQRPVDQLRQPLGRGRLHPGKADAQRQGLPRDLDHLFVEVLAQGGTAAPGSAP